MKRNVRLKEIMLDLVFPRRCPICDHVIGFGKGDICRPCLEKIRPIRSPFCMKCGKPLEDETEYCMDCGRKRHLYIRGTAVFEYRDVASAIYRFKYGGRQEYAAFFGRCMAERLKTRLKQWKAEALVPVPIHPSRKKQRGYNQAELLAREISSLTGLPVCGNLVARGKKTMPQKNLDDIQRQNNLKKAYKILRNDVKLNTIVIIDDIYTTGSTIDMLTATLHAAGIKNVFFAVLAIGRGQ